MNKQPIQQSYVEQIVLVMIANSLTETNQDPPTFEDNVCAEAFHTLIWHHGVRKYLNSDGAFDSEVRDRYKNYRDSKIADARLKYAMEKHANIIDGESMFKIGVNLGIRMAARAVSDPFGDLNAAPDFDAVVGEYIAALQAARERLKAQAA